MYNCSSSCLRQIVTYNKENKQQVEKKMKHYDKQKKKQIKPQQDLNYKYVQYHLQTLFK
jgi:hypothetical protein